MSEHKKHVVSIGAAVQDVFLQGEIFRGHREEDGLATEFKLGSKNEVEGVVYCTGGGATNASVTFARSGLHSSYMGRIGHDIAGQAVLDALHKDGVDTTLVGYSKDAGTGYSVLLLAPSGERTILTYRGASAEYKLTEHDFHGTKPDWFYISSLSGDFSALTTIVKYAQSQSIKIAINPGKKELANHTEFKKLLGSIDILSVNKEEMEQLFGTADLHTLMGKALQHVSYIVVTDGPKGSYIAHEGKVYKAGMYADVKVVDRAGAGDAFCSGFVAKIVQKKDTVEAITFASANSTNVVRHIGAKTGILDGHVKLHKMPIAVSDL